MPYHQVPGCRITSPRPLQPTLFFSSCTIPRKRVSRPIETFSHSALPPSYPSWKTSTPTKTFPLNAWIPPSFAPYSTLSTAMSSPRIYPSRRMAIRVDPPPHLSMHPHFRCIPANNLNNSKKHTPKTKNMPLHERTAIRGRRLQRPNPPPTLPHGHGHARARRKSSPLARTA